MDRLAARGLSFAVKRFCSLPHDQIQSQSLHGFSDASSVALDTTDTICLLTAKSKLAPIKKQTIPRLELCGAQVLSKLLFQSAKDLGIPMNSVYAWSDSAVLLGWMKTSPGTLKIYVFHRVQDTINIFLQKVMPCYSIWIQRFLNRTRMKQRTPVAGYLTTEPTERTLLTAIIWVEVLA